VIRLSTEAADEIANPDAAPSGANVARVFPKADFMRSAHSSRINQPRPRPFYRNWRCHASVHDGRQKSIMAERSYFGSASGIGWTLHRQGGDYLEAVLPGNRGMLVDAMIGDGGRRGLVRLCAQERYSVASGQVEFSPN
jgi:hypothetical protein